MPTTDSPALAGACSALSAALLEGPTHARVLAALSRVLYLQAGPQHTDVLPVEASDGIGLPTALRITARSDQIDWGVTQGEQVAIAAGRLHLPGRTIHVGRVWRPVSVPTVDAHPERAWVECQWGLLPPAAPIRLGGLLVGAGQGLTPSGDDHLCGALLAWRAVGRDAERADLWSVVRPRLKGTTGLSASLLTAAASGYAIPAVHTWITALAHQDGSALAHATPAVLALGHSSGQDLIRGALTALTTPIARAFPVRRPPPTPPSPGGRTTRVAPSASIPA